MSIAGASPTLDNHRRPSTTVDKPRRSLGLRFLLSPALICLQVRVLLLVLVIAVLLRHIYRGRVLSLVVAAMGVFCRVLQGRALSLVIPAVVLRHILQGRRLSIGGDNGSGICNAFAPVLTEVVVVVGQVYLLLLYPMKVVSGKIFSEKLALLEFKNSVSDPFRPDGLNHCSGSGVRCSLDSRIVTIKM